jgi:hypothetical protein
MDISQGTQTIQTDPDPDLGRILAWLINFSSSATPGMNHFERGFIHNDDIEEGIKTQFSVIIQVAHSQLRTLEAWQHTCS